MYAFSYWHAYYDSLFLRPTPQPSHYLLQQLQITMAVHMNWPVSSDLPHLSRLFQSFQKHLMSGSNWCSCFCEEWELQAMEERINDVVILLYCEKIYGKEYWQMDHRRVQASFIHFCIIFRHYLLAILPEDAQSIQQAHSQGRLPTSLESLQAIVNVILEHLKPIHRYLFSSYFLEQNQLTLELFTGLSHFLQRLPKLQVEEIMEVPRLMRYICLSNTLQVNNCYSIKEFKFTRKKSETFQQRIEVASPLKVATVDYDRKSDILVNREFIKKNSISSRGGSKQSKERRKGKHEKYSFFRFNKNLSKLDNRVKKNLTVTTSTKGKSSTMDRSERFRSTTMEKSFAGIVKSRTFEKKNSKTKHRKSQAKSNESSAHKVVEGRHLDLGEEETERAVKMKTGHKIAVSLHLKNVGRLLNLSTGKPKGWAAIREHFFTRIASKKLKKILNN